MFLADLKVPFDMMGHICVVVLPGNSPTVKDTTVLQTTSSVPYSKHKSLLKHDNYVFLYKEIKLCNCNLLLW